MISLKFGRFGSQIPIKNYAVRNFSTSYDDDFIQRSSVPSMHFQPSLPRLPIPDLPKTCARYLRALEPLVNSEEFSRTCKIVKNFEQGGISLHKELVHIDSENKHTSYISAPWFDTYLADRKPLPLNNTPAIGIAPDPRAAYNDPVLRATNCLISTLRFMKSLRANLLEPEVFHLNPKKSDTKLFRKVTGFLPSSISWYGAYLFKAFPLDMSQYQNLFNTTRLPRHGKDELYYDPSQKHIIVVKNGHFYSVEVIDSTGSIIKPDILMSCLKSIYNENKPAPESPVGILTTMERNEWSEVRSHLESIGNVDVLRKIDGSLFLLAFDSDESVDFKKDIQNMLHSDGISRWFDKSITFIINKSGNVGINFEHSWGDGVAVVRYITDMFKDSTENPKLNAVSKESSSVADYVKPLDFKLDDKIKNVISDAKKKYEHTTTLLDVDILEYKKMGRDFTKIVKVSPDSLMQLAFQLAHYRLHKRNVGTYESCSTAAFKHGRTETMRPCTMETFEFCKSVDKNPKPSLTELKGMIMKCSEVHSNLIKEAAMGQGFDRHLFVLKKISEEKGKVAEIFNDPSYSYMNHCILSTSTLSSDIIQLGAFGPVVPDGYGIGYNVNKERMGCIVTSFHGQANGRDFLAAVECALDDLYSILK